jgi:hypothetical protein
VPRLILAAVSPDNTPHGYNWTFAFPMLLFIAVALVLYMLLGRPHRRVPGEPISVATGTHLQSSSAGLAGSESDDSSAEADAAGAAASGVQDATAHDDTAQADTGASE